MSKPLLQGYDFNTCGASVDFDRLLSEFTLSTGLQSTYFARALEEIHRMISAKLDSKLTPGDLKKQQEIPIDDWKPTPCTIFLSKY